ncbi:MAG: alpha/beta fold hydrolase [Bacteroidetes bacterium]|nr:alpha/beta fold hydrolase [Bacteroidota bacterium]
MGYIKRIILILILAIFTSSVYSQTAPVKVDLYSNGVKLNADFYPVSGEDKYPTLILLHGYPGGEGDQFGLGKKLSLSQINVLVFNFRGTWSSEGIFSFESSMDDIGAAIKFLKNKKNSETCNVDTSNIIVAGYSFGGAMALTAAIYNPEIKRIISVGGADESVFGRKVLTDNNFRNMFEQMLKASELPDGPVNCDTKAYIELWLSDIDKYDQVKHAESLADRDILFLGGWNDSNVVLEEHILPLYRKL